MATQIAIDTNEIVIRYRQPYVSEALNRKSVSEYGGIQKGFRFTHVGAAANQIILAVDEQANVSAMNIKNADKQEFSVTWVRDSDLTVSTPQAAGWHHLFVDHGYVFGDETSPSMTWYSSAEVADPATPNPGMYIGSIEGVAAGQNVTNYASTYAISDGTILKRATASTDSGSRTRVRGDNEEPVFFTDFNSRCISPVDLTSAAQLGLTAKVMTADQTATDNMFGATNNLISYAPETADQSLIIWRRAADVNNRGTAQAASPTNEWLKDYSIPAHIPVSNDSALGSSKIRLFVRYKATRNNGLRFADPASNVWTVRLNLVAARNDNGDLNVTEILTEDVALLSSNSVVISSASITLGHTNNNYIWASIEADLPLVDEGGSPIRLSAGSLNVTVPDMIEGEAISIDRILVESDVRVAIDAVDGAQTLGPVPGRYAAIGLDSISGDSVLHPYSKGLAIARGGDIPVAQTSRVVYGPELTDHNVMVGLPLRMNDGTGVGINRLDDDFSLVMSDNLGSSFQPLENTFRQSNLIINAPGQYDTLSLINRLEANGSTVPDGLRAPQRAGLTVNNGNVVINSAKGSIDNALNASGTSPSHETGQLVSDGIILNGDVRFGDLIDGQYAAGWSSVRTYTPSLGDYSTDTDVSQSLYFEAVASKEDQHVMRYRSAKTLTDLAVGMNVLNKGLVDTYSAGNNYRFSDRTVRVLSLMVVDSGESDRLRIELPDSSVLESDTLDVPIAGLREPIRRQIIGQADLDSLKVSNHVSRSSLLNSSRSAAGIDFPNGLYGNAIHLTIDDSVQVDWTGEGFISMGVAFRADSYWEAGFINASNDYPLKGQFVPYADLNDGSPFKTTMDLFSTLVPNGVGLEFSHSISIRPFSETHGDRQIILSQSALLLDLGLPFHINSASFESPDDFDEPVSAWNNIGHYVDLFSATGAALNSGDAVDATHKFRYQILLDSDPVANYPDYPEHDVAAQYRQPNWRFTHSIKNNIGDTLIEGELRVNCYEHVLRDNNFQYPDGTPNYGALATVGEYRTAVLLSMRTTSVPLTAFNYPAASTVNANVANWSEAQTYLQNLTGEADRDFSISDDEYSQSFGSSICYDASFGAKSLSKHPIALTPKISAASIAYRVRSI